MDILDSKYEITPKPESSLELDEESIGGGAEDETL